MVKINFTSVASCPVKLREVQTIASVAARFEKKIKGEVEINIVSNNKIQEINREYRHKDAVTDVLSFAWQEGDSVDDNLGQIFISYEQIKKQAREYSVTVKEEFARMLVHGLLHLVGYDHLVEKDEKKMFSLQEKIICSILED